MLSQSLKIDSTPDSAKDAAWLQSAFDLLRCYVTLGHDFNGHETLAREKTTDELSTGSNTIVRQILSLLSDVPPPDGSQGKWLALHWRMLNLTPPASLRNSRAPHIPDCLA